MSPRGGLGVDDRAAAARASDPRSDEPRRSMRYVLATDSDLVPPLVAAAALPGETLSVLVADRNLARRLRRRGYTV